MTKKKNAKSRQINVVLPAPLYEQLEAISDKNGISVSQLVRHALSLEVWWNEVQEKKGTVLVEHENGRSSEIYFPVTFS